MDKKLKLAIIIAAGVLAALLIFAMIMVLSDGKDRPEAEEIPEVTLEDTVSESVAPPSEAASQQATGSSEPDELIPAESTELTAQPPESQTPTQGQTSNGNTTPTQKPSESTELSFPYTVPGSSLIITNIDSYDGVFLEDGSDRSVMGICALVITNSGTTDVEYADISIQQGSRTLLFKLTVLRAGCTAVVQEASAAPYAEGSYTNCTADVAEVTKLEMSADKVQVLENSDGSLTVTNLTNETIGSVRIFYKFCLNKGSVYVGGITYTAKVDNLAPGGTQTVVPTHFSHGSSEVVMVRLYDSP